jgi:hypothetical protein
MQIPITRRGGGSSDSAESGVLTFSYNGDHEYVQEDDYNWTLYIKGSGLLTITKNYTVDIFLQGGGGGGGPWTSTNDMGWGHGGGGGAGGYQTTEYAQVLKGSYDISIGAGGAARSTGGTTSMINSSLNLSAAGGKGATSQSGATGGTARGGSGGGYYGDGNGSGGGNGGQGKQAFGSGDKYYGAGGGGEAGTFGDPEGAGGKTGGGNAPGGNATANTGSGGAGSDGKGGSGIVIIRNAR